MGRITRSPPKPRPKLVHEVNVSRTGMKWQTHQAELWAEVARIAGYAGYKQRSPFWAITTVFFDAKEKADGLRAWLHKEKFSEGREPYRPPPPDPYNVAAKVQHAIIWGLSTGLIRPVVMAYREKRREEGWTNAPANSAAAAVIVATCPAIKHNDARDLAEHMLRHVEERHREWFWRGINGDRGFNGY